MTLRRGGGDTRLGYQLHIPVMICWLPCKGRCTPCGPLGWVTFNSRQTAPAQLRGFHLERPALRENCSLLPADKSWDTVCEGFRNFYSKRNRKYSLMAPCSLSGALMLDQMDFGSRNSVWQYQGRLESRTHTRRILRNVKIRWHVLVVRLTVSMADVRVASAETQQLQSLSDAGTIHTWNVGLVVKYIQIRHSILL